MNKLASGIVYSYQHSISGSDTASQYYDRDQCDLYCIALCTDRTCNSCCNQTCQGNDKSDHSDDFR